MNRTQPDQARFLTTGDDFNGETKSFLSERQELERILGNTKRVGCDRTHGTGIESAQPLAKAGQRLKRSLLGGGIEHLPGAQTRGKPDRLLDRVERVDLVTDDPADLQPEAV